MKYVRKYDGMVLPENRIYVCTVKINCHSPESRLVARKILEGVHCDFYVILGYDKLGHILDEPRVLYKRGEEDRLVDFITFAYSTFTICCFDCPTSQRPGVL